ncbi:hypothetical protein Pcinc_026012 [Petrolisthes cinctipes]|uniref:C2H2-type domain-containing protein n=1 Tax=Petrolisthes cinctipes TaxID=88211 RepID=A0AAE1F849_PETCI|nr:hypothetical protein Pcinc_026012 [Petrolisthes cinctipes]
MSTRLARMGGGGGGDQRAGSVSCLVCGRGFGRLEDLRRHVRTHTGEKPYTCPMCTFRAAVMSSVYRHMRTVHNINTRATPSLTPSNLPT